MGLSHADLGRDRLLHRLDVRDEPHSAVFGDLVDQVHRAFEGGRVQTSEALIDKQRVQLHASVEALNDVGEPKRK